MVGSCGISYVYWSEIYAHAISRSVGPREPSPSAIITFSISRELRVFLYHYVVLMSHVCVSYLPWGLLKLTEIYLLPSEAIHQRVLYCNISDIMNEIIILLVPKSFDR